MKIKQMLDEIKSKRKLTKNKIKVGKIQKEIIEFLEKNNIPVHTKEIYLTHKGLSHLARESKKKRGAGLSEDDILKIPDIISKPNAVFFDKTKNKLNLLYCDKSISCEKIIKIVVDTKAYDKKLKNITLIKTAGYIIEANLKDYIKIFGNVGGR